MPRLKTKGPIHDTVTGYDFTVDEALRPAKAMRKACLLCCNGSSNEVKLCPITDCPLWPYRLGKGKTKDPRGEKVLLSNRGTAKSTEKGPQGRVGSVGE